MNKSNIFWHQGKVTKSHRNRLNRHPSAVLWFTGLSGVGKSTLANVLEDELHKLGRRTLVLDGDNVRHGLCADLGFSAADRCENLRRVAEVNKILVEAGVVVLNAFISPFEVDRERVKAIIGCDNFIQIYLKCPINICESRDVKGIYAKARAGEVKGFTGIDAPYEPPTSPDLTIDTDKKNQQECVFLIMQKLAEMGVIDTENV